LFILSICFKNNELNYALGMLANKRDDIFLLIVLKLILGVNNSSILAKKVECFADP